jgi:hypothetical protein
VKFLILFAGLLWPILAEALSPAAFCETNTGTTCTLTLIAGYTIIVNQNNSTTIPSDTKSLTYTAPAGLTNSFVDNHGFNATEGMQQSYAHTGASTGSDTVTCGVRCEVLMYAPTDISSSGNPFDGSGCFAHGDVSTSASSTITSCTLTTTLPNDIYEYITLATGPGPACTAIAIGVPSNGPTTTEYGLGVCGFDFHNITGPGPQGTIIPSGGAISLAITFPASNSSGSLGSWGIQLAALKNPNPVASSAPAPYIIKYSPPSKFTPLVLYTILRNWIKEMCDPPSHT